MEKAPPDPRKVAAALLAALVALALVMLLLQPFGFTENGDERPTDGGDIVVVEQRSLRSVGGSVVVNAVVENTGDRSEEATLRAEVEVHGEVYRRNTTVELGPGDRGRYSVAFPLPEHGYVEEYEYRVWIE